MSGHRLPAGDSRGACVDTRDERGLAQRGFYVFGAAITNASPELRDFRALKGAAVITSVTARSQVPSWGAVYPFAREAMRAFERGEHAREASAGGWHLASRGPAELRRMPQQSGNAIGGVLYVYR